MKNMKKALALVTAIATMSVSVSALAATTGTASFSGDTNVTADATNVISANTLTATVASAEASSEASFVILDKETGATIEADDILYLDQKTLTGTNDTFTGVINLSRVADIAQDATQLPDGTYPVKVGYNDKTTGDFKIAEGSIVVTTTADKVAVKFWTADGTTVINSTSYEYDKDAAVTAPDAPAAQTHYHFAGWATQKDGAVAYASNEIPNASAEANYYAVYEEDTKYDVDFMNGASKVETKSFYEGETITGPTTAPVSATAHKVFDGWSETDGGEKVALGTMGTAKKTFYAVFTDEAKYTATFYNEDGTQVVDASTTYYVDENIVAPADPEKANYTFVGWSKTIGGDVVTVANETMVKDGVAFYAKFTENAKHTVKFMNDTTELKSTTDYDGTAIVAPENPEKAGYDFIGWNTDSEATVAGTVAATITEDVTYYAIFTEKAPSGTTITILWGDVNEDGTVNTLDASKIVNWKLGAGAKCSTYTINTEAEFTALAD